MVHALATPCRVRRNRTRWPKTASGRQHYNDFRDYDPRTGRYVQSDPIGLGGGVSTFGYVGGNPLHTTDQFGLFGVGHWKSHFSGQLAINPCERIAIEDFLAGQIPVVSFIRVLNDPDATSLDFAQTGLNTLSGITLMFGGSTKSDLKKIAQLRSSPSAVFHGKKIDALESQIAQRLANRAVVRSLARGGLVLGVGVATINLQGDLSDCHCEAK